MSVDVKMIVACNHIINDKKYESHLCSRCYGRGFYFDIYFDSTGDAVLADNSIKLQQEIIKIMLEDKGDNIFHPLWGNELFRLLGRKNLFLDTTRIELIVREALGYLQNVQKMEHLFWDHMSDSEILEHIESIEVIPLDKTSYQIKVKITNSIGELITQSIVL